MVPNSGGFFAINRELLERVYELGMNPACALLVLASGSGRDNKRTSWSCNAVRKYTSIGRQRAKNAVNQLVEEGVLEKESGRDIRNPRYTIKLDSEDEMIWLPVTFVTGAGLETPPLERLRQTGDVQIIRLLLDVYAFCSIAEEAGLPWDVVSGKSERKRIGESGEFTIWGFNFAEQQVCFLTHDLVRPHVLPENDCSDFWRRLKTLIDLGLLQRSLVMFDSKDGAVLFELEDVFTGESLVERAAETCLQMLPEEYTYTLEAQEVVVPLLSHICAPVARQLYVPTYRQHTELTKAGYAASRERIESFRRCLGNIDGKYARLEPAISRVV